MKTPAIVLSLCFALAPALAHAGGKVVIGTGSVQVNYAKTAEKGVVSTAQMNHFITKTNELLASKGMRIAGGQNGVLHVADDGVHVKLVNESGKTKTGVVTTRLMSTNVAITPKAAQWNLSEPVEIRIAK